MLGDARPAGEGFGGLALLRLRNKQLGAEQIRFALQPSLIELTGALEKQRVDPAVQDLSLIHI